jgi:MFS family permease/GNAT superfamily N-acetyltransferase
MAGKDHGFLGYRRVPTCLPFLGMPTSRGFARTFAVTSCSWFLFALDRLAVTTALPTIRSDLGADLLGAEWTVNAYTLAFALLLIGGAALGDRFGRRRMFAVGIATFTAASAAAASAPDVDTLVAARAVQGAGAAIFVPLAMTLLTVATPTDRRGRALGAWGGIGGLGAALGPLLGGALTALAGWRSVFWINVPLGLALVALAGPCLAESRGPRTGLDLLPLRLFRSRAFTTANAVALLFYAALFGGLFLVTQLIQEGLGAAPLDAGLRLLPMAAMPMLLAPVGGALADRFGARAPMVLGVALVAAGAAGLAAGTAPGVTYGALVAPLVLMGAGSGLFFAPVAHAVLGAVPPHEHGTASGVSTTVRELAVVLGVTVLGAVFAAHGDLGSPARTLAGVAPALWLAAALAAVAVPVALVLPAPPVPAHRSEISPDRLLSGAGRPARTECGADASWPDRLLPTPLVRAAGPADHAAIRALLDVAYAPYAADVDAAVWDGYRTDLLDLDRHARDGELYVALVDGEVVGYAAFYPDATAQGLGWPPGWASGRGLAVHPCHRGHGVAAALLRELEQRTRESGAPVFAFHTSRFMGTARALYGRMGYERAPEFDRDMNAHFGASAGARPWPALAYLKQVDACPAAFADAA